MSADNKLKQLNTIKSDISSTRAYKLLNLLFDEGSFTELDALVKHDQGYAEVISGFGLINSCPIYAFAQNYDMDGGAVSRSHLVKIKKLYELAVRTGLPIIGIYNSIGARINEGAEMLSSYGDLLMKCNNASGVIPQISVVLGSCVGTNAMLASSANVIIMTKDAELGISTIGENTSAEFAEKNGLAHIIADDEKIALEKTRDIVTALPPNNLSSAVLTQFGEMSYDDTMPKNAVKILSENESKAIVLDIINSCFDFGSFIEIKGGYGQAFCTGLARLEGRSVGVILSNRNHDEGVADADSCEKASQFIRLCDAFSIPIITFVDTKRFSSLRASVRLSNSYAEATAPKVTIIVGDAFGASYIALGGKGSNSDATFAWPTAAISALEPQTAVAMLWQDRLKGSENPIEDRKKLIREYREIEASVIKSAELGNIDDIIEPQETRNKLIFSLNVLSGKRISRLPKKHSII